MSILGLRNPTLFFTRQFESLAAISMLPGWHQDQAERTEYLAVKVDLLRPDTWQPVMLKVMETRRAQLAPQGWLDIGWATVDACDRARPMLAAFLRRKS